PRRSPDLTAARATTTHTVARAAPTSTTTTRTRTTSRSLVRDEDRRRSYRRGLFRGERRLVLAVEVLYAPVDVLRRVPVQGVPGVELRAPAAEPVGVDDHGKLVVVGLQGGPVTDHLEGEL